MANEINTTSVGTTVPSESFAPVILGHRYPASILAAVAWVENVGPGKGPIFEFPRWNAITPNAGVKTESTGVFSNFEATTDHEIAVAEVVGVALDTSREAAYDSIASLPQSMIDEAYKALQDRLESDAFSNVTGCNVESGANADAMDLGNFAAALAEWETTHPQSPQSVAVLHGFQWGELVADAVSNAASLFSGLSIADMPAAVPGYKTRLLGCDVFTSPNVALDTGRVGFITSPGRGNSGIGVAVWQRAMVEKDPAPTRYADVYVAMYRAGVCLTSNGSSAATDVNIIGVRSRAA